MNLAYRILWFEDEMDWAQSLVLDIKTFIEELGFIFSEPRFERNNINIDNIKYEDFDLILMDYNLSGAEKGDILINKIREHNFFSEIIFYSAADTPTLRKAVLDNELDGVYCAGRQRDSFLPKVQEVIKATVKKVLDINTLRGIVMAETSDIDEKMLEIISIYVEKLEEDERSVFLNERRGSLIRSTKGKIKKIESTDINTFYYNYLFDSSHKWRAVMEIVKKLYPEKVAITHLYDSEIIKMRNPLAHVKETKDETGKLQLVYKDFIFNEQTSKIIFTSLKRHEENFNSILELMKYTLQP